MLWLTTSMCAVRHAGFLMNITWPRFRRIFVNRDYQGPSDMISDRYNSLTLRLMSSFASCFFMVFFLAIEWQIVAAVVPGMTGGSLNGKTVVFFLATCANALIFVLSWHAILSPYSVIIAPSAGIAWGHSLGPRGLHFHFGATEPRLGVLGRGVLSSPH